MTGTPFSVQHVRYDRQESWVLDMPVDAQDVAGGGQLVALVTAGVAAIERANIVASLTVLPLR